MYKGNARDISGKTVVITGANTGIGKVTAHDMASRGKCSPIRFRYIPCEPFGVIGLPLCIYFLNNQNLSRNLRLCRAQGAGMPDATHLYYKTSLINKCWHPCSLVLRPDLIKRHVS